MVTLTAIKTTTVAHFPGHTLTHTERLEYFFATDKKSGNTKAKITLSTRKLIMRM